jgi:L-ascorbate metabolism protein UlaG (beta-lactamase superfamily)
MYRCCLLALTAGLVFTLADAPAGDPAKKPTISWYGQSFFIIKSSKGTAVAIDPHNIDVYNVQRGLKADAVIFSHLHNDHTQKEVLDKHEKLKVIKGVDGKGKATRWVDVDEKIKDDIHVRNVATYHDPLEGMMYGKNSIFIIEVDGWKIAHLGDLGHTLSDAQVKKIGPVDVLILPAGGIYTLNGLDARKVQAQIRPKEFIVPMHYGTFVYDDLLPLDEFLEDNPAPSLALSSNGALELIKDRKEWTKRARAGIRAYDNKLTLERDAKRAGPVIAVLNWQPQPERKKGEKGDKDNKEAK